MPTEIWEPDMAVVFVGPVATEPSHSIGFPHLHPRDRFWELLATNGITPKRIITAQEQKALVEGQKQGSIADPIRTLFLQKKKSQLLQLGIGMTELNRRMAAESEKEKSARPTPDDVREFIELVGTLAPRIAAFVTPAEIFLGALKPLYPGVNEGVGPQPFTIGRTEVWFLGSTVTAIRGEALERQESAFFALSERLDEVRSSPPDRRV